MLRSGRGELQLSSSDPADEASHTPGNSLFTKALPLCAFGVVSLRFDFLLFKEACFCHQGLYLITERHQREMKHSCDSLFVPSGENQLHLLGQRDSSRSPSSSRQFVFSRLVCHFISFVRYHRAACHNTRWTEMKLKSSRIISACCPRCKLASVLFL